jgi:hypothetical protein
MRKTLIALGAIAAFAAAAQPAAADDPNATQTTNDYGSGVIASCKTPNKSGVAGQYGAWGHYIDGCTVRLTCPAHLQVCQANAESRIGTEYYRGQRVTLNSRMRAFSASGNEIWFRDVSCDDTDWCRTEDMVHIRGGQSASVQCNGVRESGHNRANVTCALDLKYQY